MRKRRSLLDAVGRKLARAAPPARLHRAHRARRRGRARGSPGRRRGPPRARRGAHPAPAGGRCGGPGRRRSPRAQRARGRSPSRSPRPAGPSGHHPGRRPADHLPGPPAGGGRCARGTLGARHAALVTARAPAEELNERIRGHWLLIALLSTGGLLAAVLLGLAQGRRLARPLERLAQTSRRLGAGDFSARAGHSAIPEVDAEAAALDDSALRIARLVAREREFSGDVSHQLRTRSPRCGCVLEELERLEDPAAIRGEGAHAMTEARSARADDHRPARRGPQHRSPRRRRVVGSCRARRLPRRDVETAVRARRTSQRGPGAG